jgi:moderate conductance mechanosensitive channel
MFTRSFWVGLIEGAGRGIIETAADLAKIVVLYFIAQIVISRLIDGVLTPILAREEGVDSARTARIRTLQGLLKSIVSYVLFFIAAVMTLRAFKVDTASVLTTAGVVGLAVGFGAQRLVRDVISGFFILLENQFGIGEYVTAAGVTGRVEEIGMRITRIRDDAGKLNIIANGDITNVCNHSRGPVSVLVEISVASDVKPDSVALVLNETGKSLAHETEGMAKPLVYDGIVSMDSTKTTLRFRGACAAEDVESVQMAARERFREALQQAGIGWV